MLHTDFPRPHLGPNTGPNEQNLPKMVYIIPNFLVLHCGDNFMKIRTKIANRNHANTITSVIAAKQTVINEVYVFQ